MYASPLVFLEFASPSWEIYFEDLFQTTLEWKIFRFFLWSRKLKCCQTTSFVIKDSYHIECLGSLIAIQDKLCYRKQKNDPFLVPNVHSTT